MKRNGEVSRRAQRGRRSAGQILALGISWTSVLLAVGAIGLVALVIVLSPDDRLAALEQLVEIVQALSEALQALANAVSG
ncbi:hypothetical protein ACGFIF_44160 [Kribbella sp. NPDC049174]|uniref:hypothetical protein n=1 Tax=Kribbella sp. NPDC049174 TaxID=3364112 RepID=UPI003710F6B9